MMNEHDARTGLVLTQLQPVELQLLMLRPPVPRWRHVCTAGTCSPWPATVECSSSETDENTAGDG